MGGCITSSDLAVMQLVMTKKGEQEIPGLTDDNKPRRLGPKRAANIRKTFNLQKEDNVCQYVVRREAGKKKKAPKVQRPSRSSACSASGASRPRHSPRCRRRARPRRIGPRAWP